MWILDSGSARRIQDKADLALRGTTDARMGRDHILNATSGDHIVNEHMQLHFPCVGLSWSAFAMGD
eukprot:7051311-Pyramimonas_sp.AAC.1